MKKLLCSLLSLLISFSTFCCVQVIQTEAATKIETIGVTNTSSLNVRKGAGTSYDAIMNIPSAGLITTYISSKRDADGDLWYKLTLPDGTVGYCYSAYIDLYSVYADAAFENDLKSQGFSSEYIKYLRRLHTIYPKWTFKAVKTGLNWNDVIKNETAIGRNCVEDDYYSDVWKSYEKGAYNFSTNSFVEIDSGGWVTASNEAVAYCMDPRNYMSSTTYIFAMENLSYSSSQNVTNISNILSGTFMGGKYPSGYSDSSSFNTYADAVLYAAKKSKVSAYHLASRMYQEQGKYGNSLGTGTTEGFKGYFNFFNINAYAYAGRSAIENGARYASGKYTDNPTYGRPWNTPYKAIVGGARFLGVNYINDGQNTIYFEKFNVVTDEPYTHQYMTNVMAPMSEAKTQKSGYSQSFIASALQFNIPIYSSLPAAVCKKPSASGSNNNVLKSLSVSGYSLSAAFDKYTYSYKVVVDQDCNRITINAAAYDSTATVSGKGKVDLPYGTTKVKVVCTAQTGNKRTYNLSIYRPYPEGDEVIDNEAEEQIQSSYEIGSSYISKVASNTTVDNFIKKLNTDYTVKLYSGSTRITSGLIATGNTVKLYSGSVLKKTYTVLVLGDINGDGKITTTDLLKGQRHLLGKTKISGAYLKAADINKNGNFTTSDLLAGQRHILGTARITP